MGCLLLVLGLAFASAGSSDPGVDWAEKAVKVDDDIDSVYVGYYGLGVSTEFSDRLTDEIEVRYPSEAYGQRYEVRVEHGDGVVNLYIVRRGYQRAKSEELGQTLANAMRLFADILERSGRGEYPYFAIKLPKRFEGHFRIEPIL
jgi:hypothetical protein